MRTTNWIRSLALAALAFAAFGVPRAVAEDGSTLAALELAHTREVNARLHYLAFAAGAGREGYVRIESLFRSIALAESIHARNHRVQIEKLAGVLSPEIESVVVRPTAENLAASIEREDREWQYVYPLLADYARKEFLQDAFTSFELAKSAEQTHASVFALALAEVRRYESAHGVLASLDAAPLEDSRANVGPRVCICPACGRACVSPPREPRCSCGTPASSLLGPDCGR